ncbi:KLKB1 protein, partial [Turnix velox]|nr:KLKB1 protein [Turnix velox]
ERALVQLLLHQDFRRVEGGHDLALVELATPVTLGPAVATICLPTPHQALPFGSNCWVTGWGHVAENGEGPPGASWGLLGLLLLIWGL